MKEKRRFLRLLSVSVLLCAGLLAASKTANASVTFASAVSYPVGTTPQGVAVQDFNGDGKLDLVVTNDGSNSVSFLPGNGDGTFGAAVNYAAGANPRSVAVADFNGDGKPDLAVANFSSGSGSVLLGNGDGTFQAAQSFITGGRQQFVAAADLNGDGKPDLAVVNFGASVSILLNNSAANLSFQPAVNYGPFINPTALAVGDFTGDGKPDLAVTDFGDFSGFSNRDGGLYLFTNAGGGIFTGPTTVSIVRLTAVLAADLNGDGKLDIVTGTYPGSVSVIFGNGDGTFSGGGGYSAGNQPGSVAIGDFNSDGKPDIVATDFNNNVGVLLNNGDGTFATVASFPTGTGPRTVAVGDFNGDGKPDIVTTNESSNDLSVLLNTTVVPRNVVTKTADDGSVGTLRDAITFANSAPGTTISFNIPGPGVQTIAPTSTLPAITAANTIIDGYTQPDATANTLTQGDNAVLKIVLNGANVPGANGLTVTAANCLIQGLVVNGFGNFNILLNGGGATGNTVRGCFVGTNAAGTAAAASNGEGVFIESASGNIIGGANPAARNLISGNTGVQGYGVHLNSASNNFVQNNYLGTDATGTLTIPNVSGIGIGGGASNTIGGVGLGNLISGNTQPGPYSSGIFLNGSNNNVVQGNFIGVASDGTTALGNGGAGVLLGSSNNTIGGTANGAGNVIAFNQSSGVQVSGGSNSIRGNSIFSNSGLGIANAPQNFPVITSVVSGANSVISGTLNSTANTTFDIDIYSNAAADPSGFGEGQTYWGSTTATTDAAGNATYSFTVTGVDLTGQFVTATTTDAVGTTSGFSRAVLVTSPRVVTTTTDNGDNTNPTPGSLRADIIYANANPGTTISFNIPVGDRNSSGVYTIQPPSALPSITANGTIIDGATQTAISDSNPNGPEIELNGTNAGFGAKGITLTASNCVVRGLVINNFTGSQNTGSSPAKEAAAIYIFGGTSNHVEGCYIGTDATGTAVANIQAPNGIVLENNGSTQSRFNVVGGTTAGAGNLISGNSNIGILCFTNTNQNSIVGNLIGTDRTGMAQVGNGTGVWLDDSNNNVIGGATLAERNVISGNVSSGIFIVRPNSNANTIQGNIIGLAINGSNSINSGSATGVSIVQGAQNTRIGGTAAGAGNVISDSFFGVYISDPASVGTIIEGNLIGTDKTGTVAKGNSYGVYLSNVGTTTTIGSNGGNGGNVISGNSVEGVHLQDVTGVFVQANLIGTDKTGAAVLANKGSGVSIQGNSQSNVIGGTTAAARNVISGNGQSASDADVLLTGSSVSNNTVKGNYIGTNSAGTAAIPGITGVNIFNGAHDNFIGGTATGAGNIISGNTDNGINIDSSNSNSVQGNFIGTNAAGTSAVHNGNNGIYIRNASSNNIIGGTTAGAGNVISGNPNRGLTIGGLGTTGNQVQGNIVGLDATGTTALHYDNTNSTDSNAVGIEVSSKATNNIIGGTVASARNIVSGNGIAISISSTGTDGNKIQGNYVGTDKTGTGTPDLSQSGIFVGFGATNTTVGGTVAGAGNVVSGNSTAIFLSDSPTTGTVIQGNFIGTDPTGTGAVANNSAILVYGSGSATIGGTAAGAGNRIAFNKQDGVYVSGTNGATIRGNSIEANDGLGINLVPTGEAANTVTPNDLGDADTGPNNLQNYPVITSVTTSGSTTTIAGTLNSLANATFALDFYRNMAADPSGYGEGAVYLGNQDVTTDGSGNATFSFDVTGTFTGQFFTATTTNKATGDTSEFAQNKTPVTVTPALSLSVAPNTFSEGAGANAAVGTLTRNSSGAALTVNLSSNNPRVSVPATVTIPATATSVTFPVTAVDNAIADGPATVTLTASATGVQSATTTVTVTDNDTAGITVRPTTGLVTTEAGGTATFTVVLNSQPTTNVTIGLSSSNTAEGTVAPATLTFTPINWNVPQTVTVTGIDDAIADGDQAYTIVTAPAVSNDANYNKLDAADVSVTNQDNDTAALTLSATPSSIVEGAATTLSLTRNTPVAAALNVTLSSSDNSTLPVPTAVTIPAGQASVTFNATAVDDNVVNGTRTINLTASQQGFTSGTTVVTVTDNDVATGPTPTPGPVITPTPPPALSVTLSLATVSEGAGLSASHGTVTRQNVPATAPVTVQITSNKPTKARPAITTVTIPAGATSTTFAIDAVDNNLVDGSQSVTFTATAAGFAPGTAVLTVTDNDKPTLTASITPNRIRETAGGRAAQGTVTRNTPTDKPLVVSLSSSNTARARVLTSITIPAGATSANFNVGAINDNTPNGTRTVTIAARATGFVSGTAQVIVTDAAPASNLSFSGQVSVLPSNVAPGAGTGIGGATVTLSQKGVVFDVVQTNTLGRYQFTNLPGGTYTVMVKKDGYASFSPTLRTIVLSPKGVPRGNDFVGTPRGSMAGRITQRLNDGTVQGLAGVTVNAYSAQGVITGRTGSTGQFALATTFVSKWIVLPVQRGTYFKTTTHVAALSPTTPVLSGLDFSLAGTNTIDPTVTVLTPRPGSFTGGNQPTRITGSATDKGGTGVAVVTVALARFTSATAKVPTGFFSWKANSFITTDNPLLVEKVATGTSTWVLTGLPRLPVGFYGVRATVLDGAGNKKASIFVRYNVTGSSTVVAEPGEVTTPSTVALSTGVAQSATDSLQLRFLGALDSDTAGDAAHYTVEVNGELVTVESAGYNAATHTVSLALAEGSLHSGDRISAHWNGVLDATGHPITGQVGPVTAR